MQLSYTLQFAEGTGSNYRFAIISISNRPTQFDVVYFHLDFDSRHIIKLYTIDYRYDERESKGPEINGKYPFKNAGINLLMRARSGEPYTRSSISNILNRWRFSKLHPSCGYHQWLKIALAIRGKYSY
jgi:hypothetical protein